jgi:hypothetical protein
LHNHQARELRIRNIANAAIGYVLYSLLENTLYNSPLG